MGQGHADSQKSRSSRIEQQSRESLLSAAAGSRLSSKPAPTKTPTTPETQKTFLIVFFSIMTYIISRHSLFEVNLLYI